MLRMTLTGLSLYGRLVHYDMVVESRYVCLGQRGIVHDEVLNYPVFVVRRVVSPPEIEVGCCPLAEPVSWVRVAGRVGFVVTIDIERGDSSVLRVFYLNFS